MRRRCSGKSQRQERSIKATKLPAIVTRIYSTLSSFSKVRYRLRIFKYHRQTLETKAKALICSICTSRRVTWLTSNQLEVQTTIARVVSSKVINNSTSEQRCKVVEPVLWWSTTMVWINPRIQRKQTISKTWSAWVSNKLIITVERAPLTKTVAHSRI